MFSFAMLHGSKWRHCVVEDFNMASADEFAITPYGFEPEYEEGEESSNSSSAGDYSEGDEEEVFGRLITLD